MPELGVNIRRIGFLGELAHQARLQNEQNEYEQAGQVRSLSQADSWPAATVGAETSRWQKTIGQ
jgi:hypothetical protein